MTRGCSPWGPDAVIGTNGNGISFSSFIVGPRTLFDFHGSTAPTPDTPQIRGVLLASLTLISSQANTRLCFFLHPYQPSSKTQIHHKWQFELKLKENRKKKRRVFGRQEVTLKGTTKKNPRVSIGRAHQQQPFYRKDKELFLEGLLTISKLAYRVSTLTLLFKIPLCISFFFFEKKDCCHLPVQEC